MKFFWSIIFLFLFSPGRVSAQFTRHTLDSIKLYLSQKPKATAYLDGRNSFSNQARNNIFGAFGGLTFGNRIDIGLSYYVTYNEPLVDNYINEGTPAQDTFYAVTHYGYASVRLAYMFYKSKRWEVSIPASFGLGSGSVNSYNKHDVRDNQVVPGAKPNTEKIALAPFETGIDATYLIKPWFVFSAGMGYRLNMRSFDYNKHFSAVYYRYGFGIRFGYLYNKFKKTKFAKSCCCII